MSSAGAGEALDPGEQAALLGVVALVAGAGLILAAGHLSAFLFEGGWPSYPAGEIPGVIGRAVTTPLDPGSAWDPVNQGTTTPGPAAWWVTFLVLVGLVAGGVWLATRSVWRRTTTTAATESTGIPTVRQKDLRRLNMARDDPGELVVGAVEGHEVALKSHRSLLVLGPVRSGKTAALTVPALLEWPGPVVATSTSGDLIDRTMGWRSRQGDVHVYDPTDATRYRASGWSPLARCSTWIGATHTAWDLAMAGKASIDKTTEVGELWFSSAARSLAPYLFAAAETSRTMEDVARWIDNEERDDVLAELRAVEPDAAVAHAATFRREGEARNSLFFVMRNIVGAYLDPVVGRSARRHEIECDELLDGGPHTLYVIAPHHDQARMRPLFAALIRQMLGAVHHRVAETRRPLDAPLLVVLDDAADIAPVEDLPTLAATSAAAGMQLVTVFRDLSQIEVRHGHDAAAVVGNHQAKLLLPGAGTVDAIDLAGQLTGAGSQGAATATHWGLAPELATRMPADEAVFLHGDTPPIRVRLRPWYKSRELRRRAGVSQDALSPAPDAGDGATRAQPFDPSFAPAGPILDPIPGSPPFDPAQSTPDPETHLVPPHFPPNVSALDTARARLRRRRRTPSDDG